MTWIQDKLILGVGWIVYGIVYFLGKFLTYLIGWVQQVASWNHFVDIPTVMNGWVIVRDLCNMFFILVLLVIAFATILRIESYSWKKNLPKLLIMAVLINFSKTICGLIIDFSQVIMLTFVSGFSGGGTNNLVQMLGMNNMMSFAKNQEAQGTPLGMEVLAGILAALFSAIISTIVIGVLLVTLVFRVIMLWVYIILSPMAFFLSTFTAGQRYASQWWGDFSKQVVVGPVLAFFIWLALSTAQTSSNTLNSAPLSTGTFGASGTPGIISGLLEGKTFQTYLITIALLVGGLMVTQQMGGMAASAAGKGMGWAKKMGGASLQIPKRALRGAADVGIGTIARSDRVKNALATVGGSQNPLAVLTGARALATKAYSGLGKRRRDQEEEAKKYVGQFNDPRFLSRFANSRFQLTPWTQEVRSAARDKAPSTIIPAADRQGHLSGLDKDKLGKLSDAEWYSLGQTGVPVTGRALTYLQRNHDERGAYNLALMDNHATPNQLIVGTNNEGNPIVNANRFGNIPGYVAAGVAGAPGGFLPTPDPTRIDPNRLDKLRRQGESANKYRLADEEEGAKRGIGNLSVNSFARGQGNVMAVDFDKLGIEDLRKGLPDTEFSKIKGVNLNDSGTIQQVAAKMVGILEQEISKLQSSGTSADDPKLKNLFEARARFIDPSNLKNMSLVNSSAQGYKTRDVIKTVVHEKLHGAGVQDESEVERRTEQIIGEKSYSSLGGLTPKEQPEKLVEKENLSEQENAEAVKAAAEDPATAPATKSIAGFGMMQFPPVFKEIVYQLMRLNKAMLGQEGALGKVSKGLTGLTGLVNQDSTPLEVSVIAKKIQNNLEKTNV